jgi:NAD(P)-dependent dehydrogenase (short-subunit alcohol dehydrogenase family)
MNLSGKVALVVRAGEALGPAIAAALESAGATVLADAHDIRLPDEAGALVERCVAQYQRLDVVVILPKSTAPSPFLEQPEADWDAALASNVAGTLYAAQAAARQMVRQGQGGRVVLVSSVASEMPLHETSLMGTTLAAVNTLARVAAVELGPHNITVNVVAPGWTACGEEQAPNLAAPFPTDAQGLAQIAANIPLGRVGRAEEVAALCAFLASQQASYLNGAYITVDGGYAISKGSGGTPYPGQRPWPSFDAGYDPLTADF